jgi:hypothetical protein
MYVFINENPIHSLDKFYKGDLYKRDLPTKTLEWVDYFEELNSKGIIIGHIQICRGEILGI